MEKVNLRGIFYSTGTIDEITKLIRDRLSENTPTSVFTPNSEIAELCIENPDLYEIINTADITVPDGIGIIKAAKILGVPIKHRIPGIELGEKILASLAESNPVYLLGGKAGIAEEAAVALSQRYPTLRICGTHDGYFQKSGAENDGVIREIAHSGARVLFVCLGAPAQERWIAENKAKLPDVLLLMGLGGSLDVFSGRVKRAPTIFQKAGLEWLYRLLKEPKRIGRMMKLPKFYLGTVMYRLKQENKSSH